MTWIRICVLGHSGSGKSLAARYLISRFKMSGHTTQLIKLAEPLYRLQANIYDTAGQPIEYYAQDQRLLEWLARELRRINPFALAEDFERRLDASDAFVILNDDLRDVTTDYPFLKALGFLFVRIYVSPETARHRLEQRRDLATVFDSAVSHDLDGIICDFQVNNDGSTLQFLHHQLDNVVTQIMERYS